MSQYPKEQTAIATWNELSGDLKQMGVTEDKSMNVSEVTHAIARQHGYAPEQVMNGLLEGVAKGDLTLAGDMVKFRAADEPRGSL